MAEIGNDVSKRIYEAKVAEIIAKRATPDCSKDIRENWIKAKYLSRAFINTDALKVSIYRGLRNVSKLQRFDQKFSNRKLTPTRK